MEPRGTAAEIVVDLAAIRHNVRVLRAHLAPVELMVVVKADGYGHGAVEVARAARDAGAPWLGAATIAEGLALRAAGDTGPILTWLDLPGSERYAEALAADLEVTAYSRRELALVEQAAAATGRTARVQLKVDTGLSRGGCAPEDWPGLVAAALAAERGGSVTVTGVWSHLAASDEPGHPANELQGRRFAEAVEVATDAGLRPRHRHLANSAGALLLPRSRFDLVRVGLAAYGLDPAPGHTPELGLLPAMTVQAPLVMAKHLRAGEGVSYGHTWVADRDTTVGLVPVGYADGVPRHASSRAEVWVAGRRRPIRGRVCMDQFVVDLDGDLPEPGEPVVLFGAGTRGEPTAQDWAEACGTISYEIVSRIGGRLGRRHVGEEG
ncbi:alanine racemase [Nocardioides sp.]|uniref:alanine racemase n=1 Tax=Nocardioides sp. TaxID=35761 RepID=UPI00352933A4